MCTINFIFGRTAISFQFQVSPIWGLFLKLFRPFRAIFQNPRGYLSRSLRIFLEFGLDLTLLVMGGGVLKTHSLCRSRLRNFFNSNHTANFLDFSYFVNRQLLKNLSRIGAPSAEWRRFKNCPSQLFLYKLDGFL